MLFNTEHILLIKIVSAERIHCTKAAEKIQVKIAWNERRLQSRLKYIKEPTHLNGIHGGQQRVFSVVGVFSGSGSTQLR